MLNLKWMSLFWIDRVWNVHKTVLQLDSSICLKSSGRVCVSVFWGTNQSRQRQVLVSLNSKKELKVYLQCDRPHSGVFGSNSKRLKHLHFSMWNKQELGLFGWERGTCSARLLLPVQVCFFRVFLKLNPMSLMFIRFNLFVRLHFF